MRDGRRTPNRCCNDEKSQVQHDEVKLPAKKKVKFKLKDDDTANTKQNENGQGVDIHGDSRKQMLQRKDAGSHQVGMRESTLTTSSLPSSIHNYTNLHLKADHVNRPLWVLPNGEDTNVYNRLYLLKLDNKYYRSFTLFSFTL